MAMRDEFATCPRCATALDARPDRWTCGACQGALLEEATVSQMIAAMLGDQVSNNGWKGKVAMPEPLVLVPRDGGDPLTCPRCTTTMTPVSLYGIAIDRCAAHGVWFDRKELEDALARAPAAHRVTSTGETVFGVVIITAGLAAYILSFLAG